MMRFGGRTIIPRAVLLLFLAIPAVVWGQAVARLSEIETQPRDCLGIIGGTAVVDICGVCNGGGRDRDVCGVCFGNNRDLDVCGQCFRNGADQDACGICFGPGTGVCPGCPFGDRSCLVQQCPTSIPANLAPGVARDACVVNPLATGSLAGRANFLVVPLVDLLREAGVSQSRINAAGNRVIEGNIDGGLTRKVLFPDVFNPFQDGRNSLAERTLRNIGADNRNACFICSSIRVFGCFPPGEEVQLANGDHKKVEDVRAGDLLWNPVTNTGQRVEEVIEGPEELPLIELGYQNRTLRVTQEHPILTTSGPKQARELVAGKDILIAADGLEHTLTVHRELPVDDGQFVINFKIQADSDNPDDHMLAAGGLVAGDLVLQNAIK